MNETILKCSDERRRQSVRDQANSYDGLNGIDYVEVIEDDKLKQPGDKTKDLCVHFFGDVPGNLVPANVRIECGERIRDIKVLKVEPHRSPDPTHEDCLRVTVDKAGDFSCYKLCLYELEKDGDTSDTLLKDFDPRYACATFSFKVDCPSTLDCRDENICPPEARDEPEINYLAKDYAGFRQLILDRLALLIPDWRERHVPDIGIALVEVLAYVGDYLSYYQDAVATEAYLDTARQRISVRRHARLVDYFMHEGCNARAWVCLDTKTDTTLEAKDFYFITNCAQLTDIVGNVVSEETLRKMNIPAGCYDIFEPVLEDKDKPVQLYAGHSEINFYTWGNAECCLPRGATSATLLDKWVEASPSQKTEQEQQTQQSQQKQQSRQAYETQAETSEESEPLRRALRFLKVGDVLIFEEVFGPKTGDDADANPAHRCVVRLTKVEQGEDTLMKTPVVEIEWAKEDALPFPLCLSARLPATVKERDCDLVENVSVARGNVILVDYGKTIVDEKIDGEVPTAGTIGECMCEDGTPEFTYVAGKFRFTLKNAPLTFSQKISSGLPASLCLKQDPRDALPSITLSGKPAHLTETFKPQGTKWQWSPKFDLLNSDADEQSFVVEMDNDRRAHIRFGDGESGRMPEARMTFTATYRIGGGTLGNVGAEAIKYLVTSIGGSGAEIKPRNPMPAQGGKQAEPIAEVKMFAPGAFRKKLERAITAEDYATLAGRNAKVQRAAGRLRWTGSWLEARVDIDPLGAGELSDDLQHERKKYLYPYRRIGHDLAVMDARYVPLDIGLAVCAAPHYLRGHVEAALRDAFSNRVLPNGRRGFFHPDKLSFGDSIHLSAIVAAAQAVEGVTSVSVTRLQRLFERANNEIANGVLPLQSNEIARLDNNPNFPERGNLTLTLQGGR
jgi:hypothetical protein